MITVGRKMATGEVVIRNRGNDTVLVLSADPEEFSMFADMVVGELNDLDPETDYHLEEYEPDPS